MENQEELGGGRRDGNGESFQEEFGEAKLT